jgi:5-hydroxyisourate hydrolase-like protein (transthyretin family)
LPSGNSSISGVVTDAGGKLLKNVTVIALHRAPRLSSVDIFPRYVEVGRSMTDSDGAYRITRLPAGEYVVGFRSPDYATEILRGVEVNESVLKSGIDATLGLRAVVRGIVSDPSGQPVSNIVVAAYPVPDSLNSSFGVVPDSLPGLAITEVISTSTDISGKYELKGLDYGNIDWAYDLQFTDSVKPPRYSSIAFGAGAVNRELPVEVNVQVGLISRVRGQVTDSSGQPLPNIEVEAFRQKGKDWVLFGNTSTNIDGTYAFDGLDVGSWQLKFNDSSQLSRLSTVTKEFTVAVSSDYSGGLYQVQTSAPSDINVVMLAPGGIVGLVTDLDGHSLGKIVVSAYQQEENGSWKATNSTKTADNGEYSLEGLDSGDYRLCFADSGWQPERYISECYDDSQNVESADNVWVSPERNVRVDIELQPSSK